MSGVWKMSVSSARSDLGGLAGSFLVLLLAGGLLSAAGVVIETGLRAGGGRPGAPGDPSLLLLLAASFSGTALMVVVLVVASTFSLAIRRHRRTYALLQTIGATRPQIRRLVSGQVVLVAAVAAPVGALMGMVGVRFLTPTLVDAGVVAPGFALDYSVLPVLAAIALLLPTSLLAALVAVRSTVSASPSTAVEESVVEATGLSRARRAAASVCALLGLGAAFSPLLIPGTIGAASAGASALLLVSAAALSGPQLIGWLLRDGAAAPTSGGRAPVRLALANSRGFSHRLSTAIVPLAVALALGSVQTSTDSTVAAATAQQLTAGLHADLVVANSKGLTTAQVAAIRGTIGVRSVSSLSSAALQVQTDSEGPDGLAWESATVRGVAQGRPASASLDPGVEQGTLAALGRADTVAISRDVAFSNGQGLGDRVRVRYGDGHERAAEVVAIYDRGLGFGDYLFGQRTLRAQDPGSVIDIVLVTAAPATTAAILQRVSALGLTAVDTDTYVATALASSVKTQSLSTTLLLVLLLFIGLAATTSLVMSTAGRRGELALLQLVGATRRQIVMMATVESLVIGAAAWAIGTLAAFPAVIGIGHGLLGGLTVSMDLRTYGLLSLAVLVISVLSVVPTAARLARGNRTPGSLRA
ncbi:MAG: FtsX-like permease family protein [Terracoccus sp.]